MKPLTPFLLLVTLFSFSTFVYAQYYSTGWQPGQGAVREDVDARKWAPGDNPEGIPSPPPDTGVTPPTEVSFHWSRILTEGLIGDALLKIGINYTAAREEVERRKTDMWDPRIPLITDDNYESLIVNETFFSEEEERERVWFLIVTIQADQPRGLSQLFDEKFDAAYDISVKENDLPHVRWGRVDYISVTALTTKWVVWQAPKLVILTDRGKTLRFLSPNEVRLDVDAMRNWLEDKAYLDHQTWNSSFAPGGSNEWVLDYFAQSLGFVYSQTIKVPRFILILATGAIASFVVQFLHRGSAQKQESRPKKPLPQHPPKRLLPSPAQPPPVPVAENQATTGTGNTAATNPLVKSPPVKNPPVTTLPVENQPATNPSTTSPPTTTTTSSITNPPITNTPSPSKPKKRRGKN